MQNKFDDIDKKSNNLENPFVSFNDAWAALKPKLDREAIRRKERRKRIVFFLCSLLLLGFAGGIVIKYTKFPPTTASLQNKSVSPNVKTGNKGNLIPLLIVGNAMNKLTNIIKSGTLFNNHQNVKNEDNPIANLKGNKNQDKITNKLSNSSIVLNDELFNSIDRKKIVFRDIKKNICQNFEYAKNNTSSIVSLVQNNHLSSFTSNQSAHPDFIAQGENNPKNVKSISVIVDSLNRRNQDSNVLNLDAKILKIDKKKVQIFHFGVEFDLPIQTDLNTLNINGEKQPLSLLIPQFFGSYSLSEKQTIMLRINPFSQFYSSKKTSINISKYETTIQHAATINENPQLNSYTQIIAINKLIALQASLLYQYQLTSKLKAGFGLGVNLLQGAILENKVIENNKQVTTDNLYGIDRNSKEWNFMKTNFFNTSIELAYRLKMTEVGVNLMLPFVNVVTTSESNTSFVNSSLFFRWQVK